MWRYIKNKLDHYQKKPKNRTQLEERINAEWNKLTADDCCRYIDSMPRRIKDIIKSKGGPTKN